MTAITTTDELTESSVTAALKRYEKLFAEGDIDTIVEDFTDDVEVRYAPLPPFTGKENLRKMLKERLANIRDYRLSKQVEVLSPPQFAASWTGSWTDATTGKEIQIFGLEILTVRDGKFSRWSVSTSTWESDS
ncbi:nuclear transport factor 2 family protein [Pseudonocardia spinosispora]|uniref:nuclear transport factor 2 family protein n=1 Tax=Pseudonocardia spinosispora TaxID=103441 RepID=UPI000408937C|nr:nuclear transport factor 2 family protein [Pseudonocardia spinosispora]